MPSWDARLTRWVLTAIWPLSVHRFKENQLWLIMNWHDFVPTRHLGPPMSTSLPAIVSPRWYPTSVTCPAHMRRDQRLWLWTTAHRNGKTGSGTRITQMRFDWWRRVFDVHMQSLLCKSLSKRVAVIQKTWPWPPSKTIRYKAAEMLFSVGANSLKPVKKHGNMDSNTM